MIAPGITLRMLRTDDVSALADAYVRNCEHLAEWEPLRPEEFYTVSAQLRDIERALSDASAGSAFHLGVFTDTELIGRFNLTGIVRGALQGAGIGYWVDGAHTGRGIASAAVATIIAFSRDNLGLHRIEASTLTHNIASQRVLLGQGFEQIGMAPKFLRIAGRWQDHNLYQRILHDRDE